MTRLSVPGEIYSIDSLEVAANEFRDLVRVRFGKEGDDVWLDLKPLSNAYPPGTLVSEFLNYLLDTAAQLRPQEVNV